MTSRYSSVAIVLHWTIAILIIGQIAGGFYMHDLPRGDPQKVELYQLHKSFGLTVLALSVIRLLWRLTHKAPALPEGMAGWEKFAARATHVLFYALMLTTPLLGWAIVSTASYNVPTMVFGLFEAPHLPFFEGVADKEELHEAFEEGHELAAKAIIGLLILHVAAALKHHFLDRNDVLARMAPIFRKRSV